MKSAGAPPPEITGSRAWFSLSSRARRFRCGTEWREDRMNLSKRISRRAMLQGIGAAIALPVLDAMTPAFAATASAPTRMAFLYVPNGIVMDEWTPKGQALGVAPLPEALPRI